MPDYGTIYRQSLGRIMTLVNNQNADRPVHACPGWTVKDVVAHLCGSFRDIAKGDIDDTGDGTWAAKQIDDYRHRSLTDIGAEWHLRSNTTPWAFQQYGNVMMAEIISHEFDIRGALGDTRGRDMPAVRSAALFYLNALDHGFREDGIPPMSRTRRSISARASRRAPSRWAGGSRCASSPAAAHGIRSAPSHGPPTLACGWITSSSSARVTPI